MTVRRIVEERLTVQMVATTMKRKRGDGDGAMAAPLTMAESWEAEWL